MLVLFHSDWGLSGRGFYMTWQEVEGGGIPPNPTNVPTIPPGNFKLVLLDFHKTPLICKVNVVLMKWLLWFLRSFFSHQDGLMLIRAD